MVVMDTKTQHLQGRYRYTTSLELFPRNAGARTFVFTFRMPSLAMKLRTFKSALTAQHDHNAIARVAAGQGTLLP